jgi:outer membrane protein assembly factor BamB
MRIGLGALVLAACGFPALPSLATSGDGPSDGTGGGDDATGDGNPTSADISVLTHHHDLSRDGLYIDPVLTKTAIQTMHRDTTFAPPTFTGHVFAQPLFVDGHGTAPDRLIIATEENVVYAVDAASGAMLWTKTLAPPVPQPSLGCGNINPLGITGTPVIEPTTGIMYIAAESTPDGGTTVQHRIYALSVADGSITAGWPIDLASVTSGQTGFNSIVQFQGGALALANGHVYVPYTSLFGDCGNYHGWVVAIPLADSTHPTAWSTTAHGGGVEGPNGIAVDGTSIFAATGNTAATSTWGGGEAIVRLGSDASFSGATTDYFAPTNWVNLDNADQDVGDSGVLLFSVGSVKYALALGKDEHAFILDRSNLGGIMTPVTEPIVSTATVQGSPAAFTDALGVHLVFAASGASCQSGSGKLTSLLVTATPQLTVTGSWCAAPGTNGHGSPIVTSSDGANDAVVWALGIGGDNKLYAFDGDTGAQLFVSTDVLPTLEAYQVPIAARGRIYVAGDGNIFMFRP